jgi:glycosyltransferase involved in cell wall biosynthesis
MNILLIHQFFLAKDGAGGSRFNEMTRVWTEKGHSVTVLSGMVNYASGKKSEEWRGKYFVVEQPSERLTVIRCHVSESYNVNFLGRLWGYLSFVFSSIWGGLFKTSGKFDVILVTSPPLFVGITAYVLSKIKRLPFVFEIRDLWPESAIDTGVLTNKSIIKFAFWFEGFIYKKAEKINVLTPAFRQNLIEKKGIAPEKIIFIPNAADFSLSESLLKTFDVETFRREKGWENKFVITYVGAHGVANHLIQVLETAKLLRDEPRAHFVCIGTGMEKEKLKTETEQLGLTNLEWLDPVPKAEVFNYILASDAGMSVLKKVDTFKTVYSNKTFDYMACKKPIFMLIDGVSRDLVEAAGCGEYVEPENPAAFAAAIRRYILLPKTDISQIAESGYLFAKNNFDRQVLAEKYATELQKVAQT